jgi:hypothetical protein
MSETSPEVPNPTPVEDQKTPVLIFSNSTYEVLRAFVEFILPASVTLYSALAAIWGWGAIEEVAGTGAAVITFLGLIVRLARTRYNNSDEKYDGVIDVSETPEGVKHANLVLKNYADPAAVVQQKEVLFKVNSK